MKFAYDIIKKPIITERSMMGTQNNKVAKGEAGISKNPQKASARK